MRVEEAMGKNWRRSIFRRKVGLWRWHGVHGMDTTGQVDRGRGSNRLEDKHMHTYSLTHLHMHTLRSHAKSHFVSCRVTQGRGRTEAAALLQSEEHPWNSRVVFV